MVPFHRLDAGIKQLPGNPVHPVLECLVAYGRIGERNNYDRCSKQDHDGDKHFNQGEATRGTPVLAATEGQGTEVSDR